MLTNSRLFSDLGLETYANDGLRSMLDVVGPEPAVCPRCNNGRTWLQPKGSTTVLYHCCGAGQRLTARVIALSEADAVERWNGGAFDWVDWDSRS